MKIFPPEDIQAVNMARLLTAPEVEVAKGNTRPVREFFQEFWLTRLTTQYRSEITS